MATHHDGLHKLEGQVESALAGEAVQNGYGEQTANPTSNTLSPHLSSGKESAGTTVAGSRDPTIKHTDSASTHSNRTGHDDHALSSNEKALSDGGKESPADAPEEEDTGLLHGLKLYLVFVALMLSVFVRAVHTVRALSADRQMFALDQSIVATAIPVIVSDFKAFDSVSWIITA